MNTVQPIKDIQSIRDMYDYLKYKNERDALLFATGIYTGLRISDILLLRVRDVRDKEYIILREKKTGKEKRIKINRFLKKQYEAYIKDKKNYECLFHGKERLNKPISRQQVYNILNRAAEDVGIADRIGTHTMRKTFGYHYYKKTKDIAMLQKLFNHTHPSITLRYIGVTDESMAKVYDEVSFLE